jgi:hypothetical protein
MTLIFDNQSCLLQTGINNHFDLAPLISNSGRYFFDGADFLPFWAVI